MLSFQHEKTTCNKVNEKTHYLKVFNRSNMCKKVKNKDGNESWYGDCI